MAAVVVFDGGVAVVVAWMFAWSPKRKRKWNNCVKEDLCKQKEKIEWNYNKSIHPSSLRITHFLEVPLILKGKAYRNCRQKMHHDIMQTISDFCFLHIFFATHHAE